MEDVNTKDMAPRRCELQFNSAGAWRSGLQFDATTVTPEFLQSADLMCRLADCGTTMRVVLCDPIASGHSVLMHWSRESGWVLTSIPLSGDAGTSLPGTQSEAVWPAVVDTVCNAMIRAWGLGLVYGQMAYSEGRSIEAHASFVRLLDDTRALLNQSAPSDVGELTDAQKHVLAMAAFCIAARGDENVVLHEDDAERILELLLQLSGLDVTTLPATAQGARQDALRGALTSENVQDQPCSRHDVEVIYER